MNFEFADSPPSIKESEPISGLKYFYLVIFSLLSYFSFSFRKPKPNSL